MYVINSGHVCGEDYVNFTSSERMYTSSLANAQRFPTVNAALNAIQDRMVEIAEDGDSPRLSRTLTIERVITRTIPARTEETTEAL